MAIDATRRAAAPADAETVVAGICGVCSSGCGVEIVLEQGRIKRVRPRRDHERGIVCTRGTRAVEIVYSPDRLLYPQLRVGARGEGRFERVSWDDAFAFLVERLAGDRGCARPGGARRLHRPRQLRVRPG